MTWKPNPNDDGVWHVNVYSKGRTWLGQTLSNFAHTPFDHSHYGHFESVEGFWYWYKTRDDVLRSLCGFEAKRTGRLLSQIHPAPDHEILRPVYLSKLQSHPLLWDALRANTLPLVHYYVYAGVVHLPLQYQWTADLWNDFVDRPSDQLALTLPPPCAKVRPC